MDYENYILLSNDADKVSLQAQNYDTELKIQFWSLIANLVLTVIKFIMFTHLAYTHKIKDYYLRKSIYFYFFHLSSKLIVGIPMLFKISLLYSSDIGQNTKELS